MSEQPEEAASTSNESDAALMNSEIVEKLKLLNYEQGFTRTKGHKPLTKDFFVRKSKNGGEQNVYFIALSSWLINLCGGKISGDQKYDDPVTMASTLITEMKNIGIECDIAPNQIRSGFGVPICTILLLLVDKALQKKNFSFKKPNFDEKKTQSSNNAPEIEDEAPDLINNEIDYGDNLDEGEKKEDIGKKEKKEDDGNGILYSGTTQEDWQRELEKISSKLKLDYNNLKSVGSNEWRNHIQTIKDNEEKFNKQIPESRAVLENLSSEIDKSLEKITKKEEVLSKNHQNIISSYKDKHKAGNNQFDEYKELNENVEAMKIELNDINDKIVKANEKYDLLSQKISDTSALGNTKQAIQNLQNENITMDMKINILNHSLLKYTLESDLGKIQLQTEGNNDASMFEDVL